MSAFWTASFLSLLLFVLLLHVFSLPANWIVLGLAVLWKVTHPEQNLSWGFMLFLAFFAAVGEGLELGAQIVGARQFGSTGKGNIGGILGAILGAIFCAPFFFGLGALFGAVAGAYAGCLILELGQGRSFGESNKAAWGAFFGKTFGLIAKFGAGAAMVAVLASRIW